MSNALPAQPGSLQWRYGFAGLMAAYLNTPILGLLLMSGLAYGLRHPRAMRILAGFEMVMALGLVAIIVFFALDLVQVRASRPEPARAAVLVGGIIAILKHLSAASVLVLLGVGGWKTVSSWDDGAADQPDKRDSRRIVMKGGE